MTESMIYKLLNEMFSEIFVRDDIVLTPETKASDIYGWDSFKQIEIVMAVEDRFGVRLRTREIDNLRNVGDLVAAIVRKIG
jgi:acyl carrier protein